MFLVLIICIIIGVIFFSVNLSCSYRLHGRCTGMVIGRYVYCEWAGEITGQFVQAHWNPVFEYRVDNMVYLVELEIMAPNNRFEMEEVEVHYLPSNPEICFIKGYRGKMRSKQELDEDEK